MKKYRALIGAILRVLVIAAMWIWLWWAGKRAGAGSLGLVVLVLPMLAISIVLFIGAILRLSDYLLLRKWERGNVTETTPKVKTHKSFASILTQSLILMVAVILLFQFIGLYLDLVIIAVFVVLKLIDE